MATNPESFVYCWTDLKKNKLYVGWHKGSYDDGYVCSSKIMKEQYDLRPSDFSRQIIASGDAESMAKFESLLLKKENVSSNETYYNMHNGNGLFFLKGHTTEAKKKIALSKIGIKRPDLTLRNLTNNPTKNPEIAKKCGRNMKGISNPMYKKSHKKSSIQKISENRKGKVTAPKSEETKRKMSEARKRYWDRIKGKSNGD